MKVVFVLFSLSCLIYAGNFVKSENIVLDLTKNLIWQDNIEVTQNQSTFSEAKIYCKSLFLNGFADWRIPTIKELQTIVDIEKSKPAIDNQFKFIEPTSYWSGSEDITNAGYGWYVGFKTGATYKDSKDYDCYVRCVRTRFRK